MPDSSDNSKKGDSDIYLAVDEEYHREVVGMSPGRPGTRVLQAMNDVSFRRSRIDLDWDYEKEEVEVAMKG